MRWVPGLCAEHGEPGRVEVGEPAEEERERGGLERGAVPRDGGEHVAGEPEEERRAEGSRWIDGRDLEDEREEVVRRFEVGGQGLEIGGRVCSIGG